MKFLYLIVFLISSFLLTASVIEGQETRYGTNARLSDEIAIYPNPVEDYFSIRSDDNQISRISVHNIVGKEVAAFEAKPEQQYQIEHLRQGIYIVRIYDRSDNMIRAVRLSKT